MASGLTFDVLEADQHRGRTIQVTGDVGFHDADELDSRLAAAIDGDPHRSHLTLDFARARLTDLAALEMFVRLCVRVAGRRPAAVVLPPRSTMSTLESMGLAEVIDLREPSEAEGAQR